MNLTQLQKRELDCFLVAIYIIKTEVKVESDGKITNKPLYVFIGVNITGKRVYLHHGINYKDDNEFWMQTFNNIKSRGLNKVVYLVSPDKSKVIRAAQISFNDIRVVNSHYEIVDKTNKYFYDRLNKLPMQIRGLHLCIDINEYKNTLELFNELYKEESIVNYIIGDDVVKIADIYDIPYNIRQLLFSHYFIRSYKDKVRKELNKIGYITDLNEFYSPILEMVVRGERQMYLPKEIWLSVLEELSNNINIKEYL